MGNRNCTFSEFLQAENAARCAVWALRVFSVRFGSEFSVVNSWSAALRCSSFYPC
jgi:hypothetical protein